MSGSGNVGAATTTANGSGVQDYGNQPSGRTDSVTSPFRVGQRVRVATYASPGLVGKVGEVTGFEYGYTTVKLDGVGGHNWWLKPSELEPISDFKVGDRVQWTNRDHPDITFPVEILGTARTGFDWLVRSDVKASILAYDNELQKIAEPDGGAELVAELQQAGAAGITELEDLVNQPAHYTSHPSGVEAIDITQHMNFCLGNAMKYIWRAGQKTSDPVMDLKKAVFYINKELERIQ